MAAGIPGAGIGGVFYLISALMMPFRELALVIAGRGGAGSLARWRVITMQVGLAVGILIALWITGLLLGFFLLERPDAASGVAVRGLDAAPTAFRMNALLLSFGTLAVVMIAVQIARIARWISGPSRKADDGGDPTPSSDRRIRLPVAVLLLALVPTVAPRLAQGQTRAASHRAAADSAYADGDVSRAEREYRTVLSLAPDDSRAVFRLAQLVKARPAESVRLYARYTTLEPGDAWGHLALADARARGGDVRGALRSIDAAARIAPAERDVVLARARVLSGAGYTDDAIVAYEQRVAAAPNDAEAWRELAAERRRAGRAAEAREALARAQRAAPDAATARRAAGWRALDAIAIEPQVSGTRDSDANATWRGAVALVLPAAGRARVTGGVARQRALGGGDTATVDAAQVAVLWRPRAAVTVDLSAGGSRVRAAALPVVAPAPLPTVPTGPGRGRRSTPPRGVVADPATVSVTTPTGLARVRWRAPAGGPSLDVRASRTLLDATPLLARNQVTRNEAAAQVEIPLVLGLRARAQGRAARYAAVGETNTRTLVGGALVRPVAGWGEASAVMQHITFESPGTSGFFAPRMAQVVEAATYLERESAAGVVLAMDIGAGVQRAAEFGAATGAWSSALRGWARLDVPLSASAAVRAELDAYDGGVARESAGAGRWRWASLSIGLHLAP